MTNLLAYLTGFLSLVSALNTDECNAPLGMQSGEIPDERITASSYFENAVRPAYARAHAEVGGGAWCPRSRVYNEGTEYLEVDLGALHVVTGVEVQGRFGNGMGKEFTEIYKLLYWRPSLSHWITYKNGHGEEFLKGNSNTYLAQTSQLQPPVIASRVRFVPYSDHPRTVCLRVEVYGCPYTDGVISYSMVDGDARGGDGALRDVTYDGERKDGVLSEGLGQLIDGETGHTNFRVDSLGKRRGYEWVGWKNDTRGPRPVEITFEFDAVRNFSSLYIYTNNLFTKDAQVFSHAQVFFSIGGEHFHVQPPVDYVYSPDRIFENARNVSVKLHGAVAKVIKLRLYFALRWIMISEVAFDSVLCRCNISEEEAPVAMDSGIEDISSVLPASPESSSLLVGGLVTLGVMFILVPIILGILYYRFRTVKNKSMSPSMQSSNGIESKKVTLKMKDLHINMSHNSYGYSKAKTKLYGHVVLDEEIDAMYQEPFKGPMHNPGYHTLGRPTTPLDSSLKMMPDTDDSVDYAVPDVNMTPPPPFSEVYTPPPPIPLSRPPVTLIVRSIRDTPPPIPQIPPPPEQEYYAAPRLCQASNIQGVTGTVIYASPENFVWKDKSIPEIPRHRIKVLETVGEGQFGIVQLCEFVESDLQNEHTRLCAVKTLKDNVSTLTKEDFRREMTILSQLEDANIVGLLAACTRHEPLVMVLEWMDFGDLHQFLRCHMMEGSSPRPMYDSRSFTKYISYGAMIYMASQVASGMKYLENISFVHRDLASRNCLVGHNLTVKISDFGMCRKLYSNDYYKVEGRAVLPIRWMAWESILQGKFSTKSDVWAFGVTLWEIFTLCRRQPYEELSDDGVLENVAHCYHGDGSGMMLLPQPSICPREMYDMMTACWRTNERQRPPFWEILMFLQRKNLGYTLDYVTS